MTRPALRRSGNSASDALKVRKPAHAVLNTAVWQGGPRPPSNPGLSRRCPSSGRAGTPPPNPAAGALMAEHRTVMVAARVTPAERAAWREKAAAAGVSPSALLREAMARTRTWTASARGVERERTRQIARVGNNLNQLARWVNTHKTAAVAVTVIAHLVSFERSLLAVARIGEEGGDAH